MRNLSGTENAEENASKKVYERSAGNTKLFINKNFQFLRLHNYTELIILKH